MKRIYLLLLAGVALLSLGACKKVVGDGPILTEKRTTATFSEVEFEVPGDLIFIDGDDNEITIEAQQNILDVIETYVSNDELKIKLKNSTNIGSSKGITITVEGANTNSVKLSGSGNLSIPGTFSANSIRLLISGSGEMIVNKLQAVNLEANISGSGNIDVVEGAVDTEDLNISGSGNIDVLAVNARKADTETSGSGTMRVSVSDQLNSRISGSGDVFYHGTPAVNVSISGSGKIVKL